ncbi:hypothetical protein KQI84_10075 [bacterium]|nr:hypothetical protein [bacterium]
MIERRKLLVFQRSARSALLAFLFPLVLVAALPGQSFKQDGLLELDLSQPDKRSHVSSSSLDCMNPLWELELPFGPQAGLVRDGQLWIARLEDSRLVAAHVALEKDGPKLPPMEEGSKTTPEPKWVRSISGELDAEGSTLGPVFAGGDYWLVAAGEGLYVVPLDPEASARPRMRVNVPLTDIQTAMVSEGTLFLAGGMESGGVRIAAAPLAAVSAASSGARIAINWQLTLPLPQRREGISLFVQNGYLYVVGGEGIVNNVPVRPREMVRAQILDDGTLTSWQLAVQLLPYGVGRSRTLSMDGVHLVTGDTPVTADGEYLTSETLMRAGALEGGLLSMWTELTFCVPTMQEEFLIAGLPDSSQFILLGGHPAGSPEVQTIARAYQTAPSQALVAERGAAMRRLRNGPIGIPTVEYTTGLRRAQRENRYHVVVVIDHNADNKALRRLMVNRNSKQMLRDLVISCPAPEEIADAQARIGTDVTPAIALLTADGRKLTVHEGVPDLAQLFQVLSPAWAPKDAE